MNREPERRRLAEFPSNLTHLDGGAGESFLHASSYRKWVDMDPHFTDEKMEV